MLGKRFEQLSLSELSVHMAVPGSQDRELIKAYLEKLRHDKAVARVVFEPRAASPPFTERYTKNRRYIIGLFPAQDVGFDSNYNSLILGCRGCSGGCKLSIALNDITSIGIGKRGASLYLDWCPRKQGIEEEANHCFWIYE